jgi:hypothetical protein
MDAVHQRLAHDDVVSARGITDASTRDANYQGARRAALTYEDAARRIASSHR